MMGLPPNAYGRWKRRQPSGGGFSPIDQSPERWLRADLGVTLVSGKVSAIADQSGNGKHYTQTVDANRMTIGALAGQAALVLSGTSMMEGPVVSGLTEGHAFFVLRSAADPPAAANILGRWGTAGTEDCYPFSDGVLYDGFGSTSRKTCGNPTVSLASPRLYEVITTATEWTCLIDGVVQFTTATNVVSWHMTSTRFGRTTLGFDGEIAEYTLFSGKRTAPQRTALYGYFGPRYSLVLP